MTGTKTVTAAAWLGPGRLRATEQNTASAAARMTRQEGRTRRWAAPGSPQGSALRELKRIQEKVA